jgi:hypothetical protein
MNIDCNISLIIVEKNILAGQLDENVTLIEEGEYNNLMHFIVISTTQGVNIHYSVNFRISYCSLFTLFLNY